MTLANINLGNSGTKTGIIVAIGVLLVMTATASIAGLKLPSLKGPNLFSLVGDLSGTTTQILDNSKALSAQVDKVQGQLSQLNQQQQLLGQQMQAGRALDTQLSTQIQLTNEDVSLMRDILTREQNTSGAAGAVANSSDQLVSGLNSNASVLSGLVGALTTSNEESKQLSAELDQLSSELQNSKAEFKVFGQVNSLLNQLIGKSNASGLLQTLGPSGVSGLLNSGPLSSLTGQQGKQSKSKSASGGGLLGLGGLLGNGNTTSQLPVLNQLP